MPCQQLIILYFGIVLKQETFLEFQIFLRNNCLYYILVRKCCRFIRTEHGKNENIDIIDIDIIRCYCVSFILLSIIMWVLHVGANTKTILGSYQL